MIKCDFRPLLLNVPIVLLLGVSVFLQPALRSFSPSASIGQVFRTEQERTM